MLAKLVREVCEPLKFQFTSDCVETGGVVPAHVPAVGRKSWPASVMETWVLPAPMASGVMEERVGNLFGAGLTMKLMVLERPLSVDPECGLSVLTLTRPGVVMSEPSTVAVMPKTVVQWDGKTIPTQVNLDANNNVLGT